MPADVPDVEYIAYNNKYNNNKTTNNITITIQ